VHMANIAQTVNVLQAMILTEGEKMLCTPTYHVFDMYKVHQDATLLPSFDKVGTYEMGDDSMPQISTSASLNEAGEVNITLCNLHHAEAATVRCDLRGMTPVEATGRVLAGEAMNAMNTFDATKTVLPTTLDGIALDGDSLQITLPAHSVAVVTVK
jgi:alpha-N-arabinofuranosidase